MFHLLTISDMNNKYWIGILCLFNLSCDQKVELPQQDIALDQAYFIECYLQNDALYNVSATEVQPIFDDFILDYTLDFDIYIIGEDSVRLRKGLFIDDTGYITNYGRGVRLDSNLTRVDFLAIPELGDTIKASSLLPPSIQINEASYIDDQLTFNFNSDVHSQFNYYIYLLSYIEQEADSLVEKSSTQFLDLSLWTEDHFTETISLSQHIDSLDLSLTLMRVTADNFKYQQSLFKSKNGTRSSVTYPVSIIGNLENAVGIFTVYAEDKVIIPGEK